VAADVIDARAAGAAGLDPRVVDEQVVDAGDLDAVVVAARSDVVHEQPHERDVMRRGVVGEFAAVVDVDAVRRRVADLDVVHDHVGRALELHRLATAVEHRKRLRRIATDPDRCGCRASKVGDELTGRVRSRREQDRRAGRRDVGSLLDGLKRRTRASVAAGSRGRIDVERLCRLDPVVEQRRCVARRRDSSVAASVIATAVTG
jgi:hypothetical protein